MSIKHLTLALLMAMLGTSIQAETINCTPITSVPATITSQGVYCLTGNLATSQSSGDAITINANNVTIDLNGWKLGGQGAGAGTLANGISSSADNVTIKNGIVRGFNTGIVLSGRGAVVQDLLIDQNTLFGIYVAGLGALVEHNQVVDTGGSAVYANDDAYGIYIYDTGTGSTVSNNIISGLTPTGTGGDYGIFVNGINSTVRDNVVSNTTIPTSGAAVGISTYQSIVLNNTVSNFMIGIYNYSGGIYAHNTMNNCTTNYLGGTAGAGNSP